MSSLIITSLLWRLRRASLIETGLFEIQGRSLLRRRQQLEADIDRDELNVFYRMLPEVSRVTSAAMAKVNGLDQLDPTKSPGQSDIAAAFLRLGNLNNGAMERLGRYETMLWRQAAQIIVLLDIRARPQRRIHHCGIPP